MAGISAPLLNLIAKIKTLQYANQSGQTVGLYSAIWNNQFDSMTDQNGNKQYNIPLPCALVEIVTPQPYGDIGRGITATDITFRVHIGMEEIDAMDGTQEQNITVYDLRDKVVAWLTDFEPTACSMLQRSSETQDYSHTNFYHYIIEFNTTFVDDKGYQDKTQIEIQPPIDLEIDVTLAPAIR